MAINKDDIKSAWLEMMDDYSSSLEQAEGARGVPMLTRDQLVVQNPDGTYQASRLPTLVLPGVIYSDDPIANPNAQAEKYVQYPYSVMVETHNELLDALNTAMALKQSIGEYIDLLIVLVPKAQDAVANEAEIVGRLTDIEESETARKSAETGRVNEFDALKKEWYNQGTNSGLKVEIITLRNTIRDEWGTNTTGLKGDMKSAEADALAARDLARNAAENADLKAAACESATAGAERVDAQLDGMTVTITNRQGVQNSCNLSFDFYETYASVAAMNADIANIPKSSLVSIATDNPTNAENARVYQKRSDGTLKYLFDLDQASAQAWAEWLNTKKPQIDARIATADDDHGRADSDHATATTDHGVAGSDHQTATTDHAQAESDSSRAATDHAQAESDTSRAATDHQTATADHTQAESDTSRAATDHQTATADHTQAESDTSRAATDHGVAGSDHQTATTDHAQAGSDHSRAETDHGTATTDHDTATTDHGNAVSATSRAENVASHPPYIADGTQTKPGDTGYVYHWDYAQQQYVKGIRVSLDWASMSQAEKDAIGQDILTAIGFDDVPTANSEHAVTSGGLYVALSRKQDILYFADDEDAESVWHDYVFATTD